jgi:hypothetical protein
LASSGPGYIVRVKAALLVLTVFTLAGAAAAATSAERVIGRKSTSGDFAIVVASGAAKKPVAIRVRVTSVPRQPVQVTWRATCRKGTGSASRQGQFRATTPVTRAVRFPMLKPDRCSVSASAQLELQGALTVTLLAR